MMPILIEHRQRGWILAAIAYYRARVEIYKLMVQEWQEELHEIAKCEHGKESPKPDG